MRLLNDVRRRNFGNGLKAALALAGAAMLSGCMSTSAPDFTRMAAAKAAAGPINDASSDYPVVVGEPFTVDGTLYTPQDTMNYDEVGYAGLDGQGGAGVTVSHRTLPLPSYVEITSLESGKTVLARVERRGPMTGSRLVALSPGASAQLGTSDGGSVRVRRVNPPEVERAELRAGRNVAVRLETPMSLVEVLRGRLPAEGSASLRSEETPPVPSMVAAEGTTEALQAAAASANIPAAAPSAELPAVAAIASAPTQTVAPTPAPVVQAVSTPGNASFDEAFGGMPRVSTNYPLAPITNAASRQIAPRVGGRRQPAAVAALTPISATPSAAPQAAVQQASLEPAREATGAFVIQAAAFSSEANAARAAESVGGFVTQAGNYYRVRVGPYSTRGQADEALAKVRAAGYSDARVFTNS